jgi:hypothetical protein
MMANPNSFLQVMAKPDYFITDDGRKTDLFTTEDGHWPVQNSFRQLIAINNKTNKRKMRATPD